MFSAESIIVPGGLTPRAAQGILLPFMPAWRSSAQSDVLAGYRDFGDPG